VADILTDVSRVCALLALPFDVGAFKAKPPDTYVVLTPLFEESITGDGKPLDEIQELRVGLFARHDYVPIKRKLEAALLDADFTITDRRYVTYETDTGYHQLVIDVAGSYFIFTED
jgi:hypothetical protein